MDPDRIDFGLTPLQEKYLEGFEWLINPALQTGKTYMICVAFIKKSIHRQGRWVKVYDHNFNQKRSKISLKIIEIGEKHNLDIELKPLNYGVAIKFHGPLNNL